MGIVDVANLKKSYGEIVAVDDISFSIEKGEIFGFLGPNGAGKTSTINMMIGLSRPTSGQIIIDGIDAIKNIKKVQRIIGIVPDEKLVSTVVRKNHAETLNLVMTVNFVDG